MQNNHHFVLQIEIPRNIFEDKLHKWVNERQGCFNCFQHANELQN